jgi:hypothetical protein
VVVEVDLVEILTLVVQPTVVLVVVELTTPAVLVVRQETPHQLHQFRDILVEMVLQALVLSHLVVVEVVPVVLERRGRHHQDHKEQKVV